ncbi:MAG: amino acid deaminase/aldolase [Deltaproteobacteria bacterium]|nr:MAG: amino acid deaminase/aldolase [Deltaproteobacteria bacterium]
MGRTYAHYRDLVRGRRLPLALCDLGLFDENVAAIARRAGGTPIRVASKSVRCRALLRRILDHDAYRGVMCFTAAEAAFLAEDGFDDLLVAYPTVDREELVAALEWVKKGTRIVLMVDDPEQVRRINALADEVGVVADLCIDVDMSMRLPGLHFGVRRSPVRTAAEAAAVARVISRAGSVRLVGVMGYEAQIAGLADAVPGKAPMMAVVRALKGRSIAELTARRGAVVDALRRGGADLEFVNGGGTGSLESTSRDPAVTEVTAGSGFFSPALFDSYRDFHHQPAVAFALPVTRRPAPGIVTCHGGGYIASGATGDDKQPQPYLPRGAELLPLEGAGEVQTPVKLPTGTTVAIGDPIFFRHAKAGELCERFATLALVEGDSIVEEVPTYRGDGKTFL